MFKKSGPGPARARSFAVKSRARARPVFKPGPVPTLCAMACVIIIHNNNCAQSIIVKTFYQQSLIFATIVMIRTLITCDGKSDIVALLM